MKSNKDIRGAESKRCSYCGLLYIPSVDDAEHKKEHNRAKLAKEFFGDWIEFDYGAREELKKTGCQLNIIKSHFSRSVSEWRKPLDQHPGIIDFVKDYYKDFEEGYFK